MKEAPQPILPSLVCSLCSLCSAHSAQLTPLSSLCALTVAVDLPITNAKLLVSLKCAKLLRDVGDPNAALSGPFFLVEIVAEPAGGFQFSVAVQTEEVLLFCGFDSDCVGWILDA